MKVAIVQPHLGVSTETFLRAHAERLPGDVSVVHGKWAAVDGAPALRFSRLSLAWRSIAGPLLGQPQPWPYTPSFAKALRKLRPDVVLAQYGPTGVRVMEACRLLGLPLVVHFHGYDASKHDVLSEHSHTYPRMFRLAASVIAVSRAMRDRLTKLGAPSESIALNPYGIDCQRFAAGDPESSPPVFLSVGRFVAKKAPHRVLQAFSAAHRVRPEARLKMIGDGPLLDDARARARDLGVESAVDFLGLQPNDVVAREMRGARALVQHSVEAPDGDSEGTPVCVIEAGASALPVIGTRHAGIPDVVVDETTGLLVDEHDHAATADAMVRLVDEPRLAAQLGSAARARVVGEFSIESSIARLSAVLSAAARPARPHAS